MCVLPPASEALTELEAGLHHELSQNGSANVVRIGQALPHGQLAVRSNHASELDHGSFLVGDLTEHVLQERAIEII